MHPLFSPSVSVKFCTISVPKLNPWLDFFFFFYFAPPTSFPFFPALLLFLLWWGFPSPPRNKRPVCRCSCWEPAEAQFTFFASSLWFHAAPLWTDALGSVMAINTNHTAIFRLFFPSTNHESLLLSWMTVTQNSFCFSGTPGDATVRMGSVAVLLYVNRRK